MEDDDEKGTEDMKVDLGQTKTTGLDDEEEDPDKTVPI